MKNPGTYVQIAKNYLPPAVGAIILSLTVYFLTKDFDPPDGAPLYSLAAVDVRCGDDLAGGIETANERDTFRMALQPGDSLRVQMRFTFPGYVERIVLQHPGGATFRTALADPASGMAVLTYPVTAAGVYLILISERDGRTARAYGVSFQVTNDPDCALPVNCGDDLEFNLGEPAQMDMFAIPLKAGDSLRVQLRFFFNNFIKQIVLHHPDGTPLDTARALASASLATLVYPIAEDGVYLVRVSERDGEWARLYGISFQVTNNPACARAVRCGEDLFFNLSKLGQMDIFAVPLNDGDVLRAQMKFTFGSYVEQLMLYAPDGKLLQIARADPVSGMAVLTYPAARDGTYLLLASERDGEWARSYGLSLQVLNEPDCAVTVRCSDDLLQDINQLAEQDAFRIFLQAGEMLRVQMRFVFNAYRERLQLYDPQGRLVAAATADLASEMAALNYLATESGNYLVVATEGNGDIARPYGISFQVLNQPACSESIADRCVEDDRLIGNQGEMDSYTFTAGAGDALFLEIDAEEQSALPVAYLYDEEGVLLTQSTPASDERALIEGFSIPEAGNYYLVVTDELGRAFGAYRLTYNLASTELEQAVNLSLRDTVLCAGDTLHVDIALPGVTYQWSTGDTSPRIDIDRPGDYRVVIDVNGCEIVHEFNVGLENCGVFGTVDRAVCEGKPYEGVVYERDTTLERFIAVVNGVDSFLSIRLSLLDTALIYRRTSLCEGEVLMIGDSLITEAGQHLEMFTAENGCDSVVITTVNFAAVLTDTVEVQLCPGDSLLIGNTVVKTPGFYPQILTAAGGCDSIATTSVSLITTLADTIRVDLCAGDSLLIGGAVVKTPGFYSEILTGAGGCDSVLVTSVSLKTLTTDTVNVELCAGDSLLIGSTVVKTPGFYSEILSGADGCDSLAVAFVNVKAMRTDTLKVELCAGDSLLIGNAVVKTPGFYTEILTGANGCDSIVVASVNIRAVTTDTLNVDLCHGDSLLIGGAVVKTPGFYPEILTGANGCDSIVVASVSIRAMTTDTLNVNLCPGDSLLIGGAVVKIPGFYPEILTGANGCDSIVVTSVSIRAITTDTLNVDLCPGDSLLIGAAVVKTPGFYPEILIGANGCDSVLVTSVIVRAATTDTLNVDLCPGDSLLIGNTVVKTPGFYPEILTGVDGCDSIVVTSVNVRTMTTDTINVELCAGDSLLIGNTVVKTPGFHAEILSGVHGCDSVITHYLTFHESYRDTSSFDLCSGETFTLGALSFRSDTTFCLDLSTVNGCDSILCYDLNFLPSLSTWEEITICENEELIVDGQVIAANTTICRNFQTAGGCDSTHCVKISVLDTILVNLQAKICRGESFTLGDSSYTQSGLYTAVFTGAGGCDSAVVLQLSVIETPAAAIAVMNAVDSCGGLPLRLDAGPGYASYQWSTGETTQQIEAIEPGAYAVYVTNAAGCTDTASIELENRDPLRAEIVPLVSYNGFPLSCPNSSDASLSAEVGGGLAPYRYRWDTGAETKAIENQPAGLYRLTVTDARGCSLSQQFDLIPPPDFVVRADVRQISCAGASDGLIELSVTEGATGPYLYSIGDAPFQSSPRFANLPAGNYQFRVQDINGCEHERELALAAPPAISLSFPEDRVTINAGDSLRLNPVADFPVTSFSWSPSIPDCKDCFAPVVRPRGAVVYTLTAVSPSGCAVSAAVSIAIGGGDDLYIPNAFSPNEDGENDFFTVYPKDNVARILSFRIFSRWGDLVFEERDFLPYGNRGWDGDCGGQPMNAGVFIYQVEYERTNGSLGMMSGDVALMR